MSWRIFILENMKICAVLRVERGGFHGVSGFEVIYGASGGVRGVKT